MKHGVCQAYQGYIRGRPGPSLLRQPDIIFSFFFVTRYYIPLFTCIIVIFAANVYIFVKYRRQVSP